MRYISTRGEVKPLSFEDTVLAGLASDGGLFVPETIPQFSAGEIRKLKDLSYQQLAVNLMLPFMDGEIDEAKLRQLVDKSYTTFRHPEIAPVVRYGDHYILELFHGPTLAFKDFALQFLGHLLEHILQERSERITIIGATSGDTGSAAIAGCAGSERVEMFILFPHNRVSEVQRRQMTTVVAKNVHCLAVKGNFDNCQHLVKELFSDAQYRAQKKLAAVNSINWARILAQVVYYFYAALKLGAPDKKISFSVPTGNFGDIFAGYIAKRMGLPVETLIIASNANNILTRCFNTGTYGMEGVVPTLSPSMDIEVSSNFERLLFELYDRNSQNVRTLMQELKVHQRFALSPEVHVKLKEVFGAACVDDEMTKQTIRETYEHAGLLIDPHTAVGLKAAQLYEQKLRSSGEAVVPIVTLATAHPAKFPDAVKAATGQHPDLPKHMENLFELPERYEIVENSVDAIKEKM